MARLTQDLMDPKSGGIPRSQTLPRSNDLVRLEASGAVAILSLNRPERHNALTPELLQSLADKLTLINGSPEIRAVLLRAEGRSFSTGGDLRAFQEHTSDLARYAHQLVGLLNQAMLAMLELPIPIIVAVHGMVTGGSLGLVLASDIVLVGPEANFTPYYALVGFSPDGGWCALLPRRIGTARAADALFTNRAITAQEAVAWGLASRLVPTEQLFEEALAVSLACTEMRRGSIARSKRLLHENLHDVEIRLELERQEFVQQIASAEAVEGMNAHMRALRHWQLEAE